MSLATRCTTCGTVFRVVQDQLKVSEGWVRCGRCNEVFNALEGLFDLERDTPPDWSPAVAASPAGSPREREPGDSIGGSDAVEKIDAQLLGPRRSEDTSTPATRISERDRLDFPDAQFDPDHLADETIEPALVVGSESPEESAAPVATELPDAPKFVRDAQRKQRWRSTPMRVALAGVALLLFAALAVQGAHHFRDTVAARWPAMRPPLQALCERMACSIEAPRRIEDVSVESSALTRAPAPDAFKLSLALRNKGTLTVAMPSVDLTLTDPAGQLVARRVLHPRDFRVASTLLPAGGDSALQLVLDAGSTRVTGYTVEIFYP
jgi:predicted Zn finger-like uncharacterized protein